MIPALKGGAIKFSFEQRAKALFQHGLISLMLRPLGRSNEKDNEIIGIILQLPQPSGWG